MRLEETVSTRCARATASGMYGFGHASWIIHTAKSSPTVTAISHGCPLCMWITGRLNATHSIARRAWTRKSHGVVDAIQAIWAKKLPGSVPP